MRKAPLPRNEELRIAELEGYEIMDTPPEKEFNELVELLRQLTLCKCVAISFIDSDRQWFKASIGMEKQEQAREYAFCAHTILRNETLVVANVHNDERFTDNPAASPINVRFYAGTPIRSATGFNVGTVCLFDPSPKPFTPDQQKALEIISAQVSRLLELRLKNKLVLKKAEELIDIERRTVQHTIQEQEKERQEIGITLHENFAQTCAACLLYLNIALEDGKYNPHFLLKIKDELSHLIEDMRKVSKFFNPVNMSFLHVKDMLAEFLLHTRDTVPFRIEFSWDGDKTPLAPEGSLNLFRIVVQYLQILQNKTKMTRVSIRIRVEDDIEILIADDGVLADSNLIDQDVAFNMILNRVEMGRGFYKLEKINPAENDGEIDTEQGMELWIRLPKDTD